MADQISEAGKGVKSIQDNDKVLNDQEDNKRNKGKEEDQKEYKDVAGEKFAVIK